MSPWRSRRRALGGCGAVAAARWLRSGAVAALLVVALSGCGQEPRAPLLDRDPRAEEACQELEFAGAGTLSRVEIAAALADALAAAKQAETPAVREAVAGDVDLRSSAQREALRNACDEAGYEFFLD